MLPIIYTSTVNAIASAFNSNPVSTWSAKAVVFCVGVAFALCTPVDGQEMRKVTACQIRNMEPDRDGSFIELEGKFEVTSDAAFITVNECNSLPVSPPYRICLQASDDRGMPPSSFKPDSRTFAAVLQLIEVLQSLGHHLDMRLTVRGNLFVKNSTVPRAGYCHLNRLPSVVVVESFRSVSIVTERLGEPPPPRRK